MISISSSHISGHFREESLGKSPTSKSSEWHQLPSHKVCVFYLSTVDKTTTLWWQVLQQNQPDTFPRGWICSWSMMTHDETCWPPLPFWRALPKLAWWYETIWLKHIAWAYELLICKISQIRSRPRTPYRELLYIFGNHQFQVSS